MDIHATLDIDVVALEEDDTVNVMLDITAPTSVATQQRPAQAVVVVLDRSGSMSRGRLSVAKRALLDLVDRLDARDSFGLVTFDDEARVEVPASSVGDLGRERIRRAIAAVRTGGMTDMSAGFLRGLQEARRVVGDGGATIILLSDGHANTGITDPQKFRSMAAKAATETITTSTIGIGNGYDDTILGEAAVGGNGNHTFAENPDAAGAAVAGEVEGLLSKTAQAVSLLIKAAPQVSGITVLNDLPCQGLPGGVMVELGDFYSEETRRLLFSLDVPAMAGLGLAQVATLELSFVSLPEIEQQTVTLPVSVNVVPSDEAAGRIPRVQVQREKLLLETQKAKRAAEQSLRTGDLDAARSILRSGRKAALDAYETDRSEDLREELDFIDRTLEDLEYRDVMTSSRMLSSDRVKKMRGMRSRRQGGSMDNGADDDQDGSR